MGNPQTEPGRDDSELTKTFEGYKQFIDSLRHRADLLDLKVAVFSGAYVIFQSHTYGHLNLSSPWWPACLSASVSAAFWPALVAAVNDCMDTRRRMESCFVEKDDVYRKLSSVPHYDEATARRSLNKTFAAVRRRRQAYVYLLYFVLLIVSVCTPIDAAFRYYKNTNIIRGTNCL